MKVKLFLIFCLIHFLLFSCNEKRQKSASRDIVTEWTGKTIQFPDNYQCNFMGNDTTASLCSQLTNGEYKILLYVDSTGCTSCKLRLFEWRDLMQEAERMFDVKVSFLFFFHPQSKSELNYFLLRDRMDYPVFIDKTNQIDNLNHFPDKPEYQCFLLDKDNKVLSIGNPSLNPKVWELYKQMIVGKTNSDTQVVTSVSVEPEEIEIHDLAIGKKSHAVFKIKNIGDAPLVIHKVNASCGCTVPVWEKQPVASGKETEIRLEIQPEETGIFHKTIQVYGNVKEDVIMVTVKGTVK